MRSQKPTIIISIDFEYAIGYADVELSEDQKVLVRKESEVSTQILALFEKYNTPATWAIVGHLLEDDCSVKEGRVHSNFPAEVYNDSDLDWFAHHPKSGDQTDPLWFDSAGVINRVRSSVVGHEIASHSYAHILYGAPNIKPEAIAADLDGIKKIHKQHNLPLVSFIFPRNQEGYHQKLSEIGITCFRGQSKFWYMLLPGPFGRLARLVDYLFPHSRTVLPSLHLSGLVNIPDSLLLLGRNGLRKLITPDMMKRKIKAGINRAVKRKEIFHLWFHPSNFSYDTDTQLAILEDVLRYATKLRAQGMMDVSTMETVAKEYKSNLESR